MVTDRLGLLHDVADAVASALAAQRDWGESGARTGQYALDVAADEAALAVLRRAGVGVLSEESGYEDRGTSEVVIIDPVDGSTNCSRGIPWFATSLCFVDGDGPAVALVVNQANGVRYSAIRGGGAWKDGARISSGRCAHVSASIIGMNGIPNVALGYAQSRVLGAVALDLCLVAEGVLDGYVDCIHEAHGVWDIAGGVLLCAEAGAELVDAWGRDLVPLSWEARRTPVAAATPSLLDALLVSRRAFGDEPSSTDR